MTIEARKKKSLLKTSIELEAHSTEQKSQELMLANTTAKKDSLLPKK